MTNLAYVRQFWCISTVLSKKVADITNEWSSGPLFFHVFFLIGVRTYTEISFNIGLLRATLPLLR